MKHLVAMNSTITARTLFGQVQCAPAFFVAPIVS